MSSKPRSDDIPVAGNRVAEFRIRARLSQGALAKLAGTSQQQISRIEKGQDTSSNAALDIARALKRPIQQVFPSMEDSQWRARREGGAALGGVAATIADAGPEEEEDVQSALVPAYLRFNIAGFEAPFVYPILPRDSRRIWSILCGTIGSCNWGFVAFESCLRLVYINVRDIQSANFLDEPFAPIMALKPGSENLKIWFRGREKPWTTNGFEMDLEELELGTYLEGDRESIERHFLQLEDEDGETFVFNADEAVVIEAPTPKLLKAVEALPDDSPYFRDPYQKMPFEGRSLPQNERAEIVVAMAIAANTALQRHVEDRLRWTYEPPGAELLEAGLAEVIECLRLHGYTIRCGAASQPWIINEDCYGPLIDDLFRAFGDGRARAIQHGAEPRRGAILTRDMLEVVVFSGLQAVRNHGYRIAPGNLWVAWDAETGHWDDGVDVGEIGDDSAASEETLTCPFGPRS